LPRSSTAGCSRNPAALAASSQRDGGHATFHGHVFGEGSSELADNMGDGSGDKGASKDLPGGNGIEEVGAGRWALVRGEVTQRQWMAVTQMMGLTADPNHLVVDAHGAQTTKLLVVLAWLTDTSVGWSELVRRMKAAMFKDRWELNETSRATVGNFTKRMYVTGLRQRLPGRKEPEA
jgi:hypothetical protein